MKEDTLRGTYKNGEVREKDESHKLKRKGEKNIKAKGEDNKKGNIKKENT